MGQKVHKKYPDFKVKEYGYSTFQKFVSQISGVEIKTENETVKRLMEVPKAPLWRGRRNK